MTDAYIHQKNDAFANLHSIAVELTSLSNAFRITGNDSVSLRLEGIAIEIQENVSAIREADFDSSSAELKKAWGTTTGVLKELINKERGRPSQ